MAAQITIDVQEKGGGWECRVTVAEGGGSTVHTVTVDKAYRDKLAGPDAAVEPLLRRSFEFLLAREPQESILRSFNLQVISRYFPEYEKSLQG